MSVSQDEVISWQLLLDGSRESAVNMAIDDVLLGEGLDCPILRIYGWTQPAFTIGYFQPLSAAPSGDFDVIRRVSGGGVVDHRNDLTFSLVFGASHELYRIDRFESYRRINQVISKALVSLGIPNSLCTEDIDDEVDRRMMVCFTAPVRFDVVDSLGRKLCGGAQRRRRTGMLHQGSIALELLQSSREEILEAVVSEFSAFFASKPATFEFTDELTEGARAVASSRYSKESWNRRR